VLNRTQSLGPPAVRVVVVEDDENDRELLTRQLKKAGIDSHVKFLADGAEALDFLAKLPPPQPYMNLLAIFLDLNLPGMPGIELLREIRRLPRIDQTPVIIMTGSLDPRDFEACRELKVAAFIPKPVTFDAFSKAITGLPHMPR